MVQAVCPNCGHAFDAPRHQKGAGYALEWNTLPEVSRKIIKWWLTVPADKPYTKEELKILYRYVDTHGMAGRVSELYALDLVFQDDSEGGVRKYRLNREKVQELVKNNWNLRALSSSWS